MPRVQLRGQRLVLQRGPKHAHSMPQYASRRRLSRNLTSPPSASSAIATPAAVSNSTITALVFTMPTVVGGRPVTPPDQSTQILSLGPARAPVLVRTRPRLVAPDGARHRAATQKVAIDPYP